MPDVPITIVLLAGAVALAAVVAALARGWFDPERDGLGKHVLVAVSRPASAVALSRFAAAVARPARGRVTPLRVLTLKAAPGSRERAEETVQRSSSTVLEEGLHSRGRVRYDASVTDGLFHGAVEYGASAVVVGWPRGDGAGEPTVGLDQLVSGLPLPVLVARLDGYRWQRVVLQVPPEPNSDGMRASLRLATTTAERLAAISGVPVRCISTAAGRQETPSELVIVPVDPDPAAIREAVAFSRAVGDVVLAICHGPDAADRRPLLSSAAALYEPTSVPSAADDRSFVPTQEI